MIYLKLNDKVVENLVKSKYKCDNIYLKLFEHFIFKIKNNTNIIEKTLN